MKIQLTSDYTPSYIAFLDILGFKAFVGTHGFRQIKDVYEHLVIDEKTAPLAMSRATGEEDEQLLRYNRALERCKIRIMSDSIVVVAPSNIKESLAGVLDVCNNRKAADEELGDCEEAYEKIAHAATPYGDGMRARGLRMCWRGKNLILLGSRFTELANKIC